MSDKGAAPFPAKTVLPSTEPLEATEFFRRIDELERALKHLAADIERMTDSALQGNVSGASLIAHILALDAAVADLALNGAARCDAVCNAWRPS